MPPSRRNAPTGLASRRPGNVPDDFIKPRAGSTPAQAGHPDPWRPDRRRDRGRRDRRPCGHHVARDECDDGRRADCLTQRGGGSHVVDRSADRLGRTIRGRGSHDVRSGRICSDDRSSCIRRSCSDDRRRERVGDHRPNRGLTDLDPERRPVRQRPDVERRFVGQRSTQLRVRALAASGACTAAPAGAPVDSLPASSTPDPRSVSQPWRRA